MADGFLARWSRRKQEVAAGRPVPEPEPLPPPEALASPVATPATEQPPLPAATEPEPPTLADAQALTPASDFKPFMGRGVAPEVRNTAMKKLFADPHFNAMDGLDIYIDDYSQPDPLPEGMLRQMASAHFMGFFDHEKEAAGAPAPARAGGDARPRDDAESAAPPDVAQSGVCTAIPSSPELAATPPAGDGAARVASHTEHDHADLRLQPDDAPRRESAGRGPA
ncbi:type IV secretory pathway VirB10-like protein [Acidovorax soli]|uniref:Type IV secretory pathway VirB10-like protein n=1 Tax=Acidovorax soli TaxID=592050 RepID=A0A7X0UBT3_9BURK|nr:DUF3306 domain-containing protein [Acidovorax soli]MBB6562696.1 type IV secretory pathway VirB10-like protein [Acidovorax soli]